MTLRLTTLGFLSLCGQVILLREVNVLFFGSEISWVVGVGLWLAAAAAGALLRRSRAETRLASPAPLGIAVVIGLLCARAAPWLDGDLRGAGGDLARQAAATAVVLVPAALLSGHLLRRLAVVATDRGMRLTGVYARESAGAAVGAALATWSPAWGVSNLALALICGLVAVTAGSRSRRSLIPAVVICGVVLCFSSSLDDRTVGWRHPGLTASRDTPAGRVSLSRRDGQVNVFADGALIAESASTAAEQFVWPALLQRERPQRIAVLGYAFDGLVEELPAAGHLESVDWVVPDRGVLEAVGAVSGRPGLRVHEADPRSWLRGAERFDCLLVATRGPDGAGANRFYTAEFFASCADHLRPGGVLALRLPAAPNVWTPARRRRLTSIGAALGESFAVLRALPGDDLVVLASDRELPPEAGPLVARLAAAVEAGGRPRLVCEAWLRHLYTSDRRAEVEDLLTAGDVPVNIDARPVGVAWSRVMWLAKHRTGAVAWNPGLEGWSMRSPGWPAAAIFAAALAATWWCRRGARRRSVALAFAAGFYGTVLEAVLLLHHENLHGSLYREIGLLLTGFMVGLVAGAAALDRWSRPGRCIGVPLLLFGAGLVLLVARWCSAGTATGLAAAVLAQAAAGFLVAGLFGYAATRGMSRDAGRIAPLFAGDLFGGCVGSLAAALWLIPLAGLAQTALSLLLLLVLAALLL